MQHHTENEERAICQSLLCLDQVGPSVFSRMKLQVDCVSLSLSSSLWCVAVAVVVVVVVVVVCVCAVRCGAVRCGVVSRWKTPVRTSKTSPCVSATRPHG